MQLVFMLSQFDANSYTYLCARVNEKANNFKMGLFNDIHEGSGGC